MDFLQEIHCKMHFYFQITPSISKKTDPSAAQDIESCMEQQEQLKRQLQRYSHQLTLLNFEGFYLVTPRVAEDANPPLLPSQALFQSILLPGMAPASSKDAQVNPDTTREL